MARTRVQECSVYFVQCSLCPVMRIPATLHYSMLLLPFAVCSHMFLSWQVNGSDGMYKYEEIILERVSFTSLHLTVPSSFNMSLFDVFSWGRMDFSPLGGSNSSVGLKENESKRKMLSVWITCDFECWWSYRCHTTARSMSDGVLTEKCQRGAIVWGFLVHNPVADVTSSCQKCKVISGMAVLVCDSSVCSGRAIWSCSHYSTHKYSTWHLQTHDRCALSPFPFLSKWHLSMQEAQVTHFTLH